MDELRSDINFEAFDFDGLVDHKLKEKLVDSLKVGPSRVHLFFLVNTCLCKVQIAFLHIGQGSEDVFFNHLHNLVQVGDNHRDYVFLVCEHLLELLDCVKALSLKITKSQNLDIKLKSWLASKTD